MNDWFSQHPHLYMVTVLVAYWVVSTFVDRLPAPTDKSGALYKSLYTALQGFSANLKNATAGMRALLPKPAAQAPAKQPAPPTPPSKKPQ
jgi:hypothetical protein